MEIIVKDFPNLLDKIDIQSSDILKQIKKYPLKFDSYKNEEVEWRMKLPMFIDSFYHFLLKENIIPTQNEFWESYREINNLEPLISSEDIERGIRARLNRTYPITGKRYSFCNFLKGKI